METPQVSEYLKNSSEKRALDLAITSSAGIVALAGCGVTAAVIAARNKVNPIFIQERAGLSGKGFPLIKLRSMDDDGNLLKGGAKIRGTGLDEIPQFINVLRGEMSVVSYRPLLDEDKNHAAQQLRAHFLASSPYHPDRWLSLREQTKPGVIGPAQTMPEAPDANSINRLAAVVAAECAYLETATLATDLHFIAKVPQTLLNGHSPTVPRAD